MSVIMAKKTHGVDIRQQTKVANRTNNSSIPISYRDLYENSPLMCRTIDIHGNIIKCNKSYAEVLGYSVNEILGKSIFDHILKSDIGKMRDSFETWKKNGFAENKEVWFERKDGTTFLGLITANSIYDKNKKLIGSNTVINDITEIYNARQEVEQKEKTIKGQFYKLKKANKLKDEFLAMITHELKTPLVPIKGYVQMLLSQQIGSINEKQKQKLEIIESSTDCLLRLIRDLLDVQKIELGELKLIKEAHNLSSIVDIAIVKMSEAAKRKGIMITCDLQDSITCYCDDTRIEQVLTNLLTNAIKFCPPENGKIHVKLHPIGTDYAKIIIIDNGIGIPKSKLGRIFAKFYQVDTSTTRNQGGTGLGLAISKGIIENHDGKIWVESKGRNKGTQLHVMLPLLR